MIPIEVVDAADPDAPKPKRVITSPWDPEHEVRALIREKKAKAKREAAEQFARAMAGTPGGADQRRKREVAGDNAGEVGAWVASYALDCWLEAGALTRREHEAADELARLYRASGGLGAWGGGSMSQAPNDEAQAGARRAYRAALDVAPIASRGPLQAMVVALSCGDAPPRPPQPWLTRPGLRAVADHLKLAPEK